MTPRPSVFILGIIYKLLRRTMKFSRISTTTLSEATYILSQFYFKQDWESVIDYLEIGMNCKDPAITIDCLRKTNCIITVL